MGEIKEQSLMEYEKAIEELKSENTKLKSQVSQTDHEKKILEIKIDELIVEIAKSREITERMNADKAYKSTRSTFEKLMEENTKLHRTIKPLKKKNSELENEIKTLKEVIKSMEDDFAKLEKQSNTLRTKITDLQEEKKPKIDKEIEIQSKKAKKEKKIASAEIVEFEDTRFAAKKPIVEGHSRRQCPVCGNSNTHLIREVIDRTRQISDYPRMYGKKLICGECGREWHVIPEL